MQQSEAQREAPAVFVLADMIRSGDVLLSRAKGLASTAIAAASGGTYSHAAVFMTNVHIERGRVMLAESDELGVGYTPLDYHVVTYRGSSQPIMALPDNPRECALLRHPAAAALALERFKTATERIEKHHFLGSYPEIAQLLAASKLSAATQALISHALRAGGKFAARPGTENAGSFCSEFVARYFEALELPLFEPRRDPATIAPSDLASSECLLLAEPNVLVTASELATPHLPAREVVLLTRERMLPRLVEDRRAVVLGTQLARYTSSELLRTLQASHELSLSSMLTLRAELSRFERLAQALGDEGGLRRAQRLRTELLRVGACDDALAAMLAELGESDPAARLGSIEPGWSDAATQLVGARRRLYGNCQRTLLHLNATTALRVTRARERSPQTALWTRLQLARNRRQLLKLLQGYDQMRRMFDAALTPAPQENETQ